MNSKKTSFAARSQANNSKIFLKLNANGFTAIEMAVLAIVVISVAVLGYLYFARSSAIGQPEIKSGISGMCLEDLYGNTSDGNPVTIDPCNGWARQQFTISGQQVKAKGMCMQTHDGGLTNGTKVEMSACNGWARQNWNYSNNRLIAVNSSKCLQATSELVQLTIQSCDGLNHQKWTTATYAGSDSGGGTGGSVASDISCQYQTDTWSGDASKVGYSVTKLSSTNGNPAKFSVKINANKGTTEVVGYPSDQCLMYSALPTSLTSAYNITPPASSTGLDYEFAYDIWLTTASRATSYNWDNDLELMIWNYNHSQTPAGSVKATLADGSKVWVDGSNSTGMVSVVLPQNKTAGTVNISSLVSDLKSRGYVNSGYNGILDVEYGIEAPYGGGQTFTVNSVSISK